MNVSQIINEAADHIQSHGWYGNGGQFFGDNPKCAGNAIYQIAKNYELDDAGTTAASFTFSNYLSGRRCLSDIWNWNDAPGQTVEVVLEAMRACAAIEESRETAALIAAANEVTVQVITAELAPVAALGDVAVGK